MTTTGRAHSCLLTPGLFVHDGPGFGPYISTLLFYLYPILGAFLGNAVPLGTSRTPLFMSVGTNNNNIGSP